MPDTQAFSNQNLSHITEELYKQNLELTERNKTLSISQRIDDIILSNVTDLQQIARQIADIIVRHAEGKIVALFSLDHTILKRLAFSTSHHLEAQADELEPLFFKEHISLSDTGYLATAVREKRSITIIDFLHLFPALPEEKITTIKDTATITATTIYPLIVRNEAIGAILISRSDIEENLKEYYEDLMKRLVIDVGIAISNTLLYKHIQEANLKLQQMDHMKDEFVSLVSHELRTPLTTVKGFISVLMEEAKLPDEQKTMLTLAYSSTDRLIKLVNDMLDVSRIESGKINITIQPLNITELVMNCFKELQGEAEKHHVTLIMDEKSKSDHMVLADMDKTKEVIINLLNNAIKFTPTGGNITVSFTEENGSIVTNITDTGRGITGEDLSKLFEKFTRLQESDTKKTEGTGLGLYISKSIIEAQKGRIWVTSPGRDMGATFSFSLPKSSRVTKKPSS